MTGQSPKDYLHRYLRVAREAMLWKLDGLSEYDVRRPMTPTGTNLLGLVKHMASVELGYFGESFGRPWPEPMPWFEEGSEINADMWATPEESREMIVDLYRRAWAYADETIDSLDLDATGTVAWWPADRNPVTLHQILIHLIAETNRHAGHADIIRELIDKQAGLRPEALNLPDESPGWWEAYCARLEEAAREAERATA